MSDTRVEAASTAVIVPSLKPPCCMGGNYSTARPTAAYAVVVPCAAGLLKMADIAAKMDCATRRMFAAQCSHWHGKAACAGWLQLKECQ
jgi:hypothetical protein